MQRMPLPGALYGRDGTTRELEYRLLETARSGFALLRSMGIAPCLIERPLPLPYPGRPRIRITGADANWLKACGVASGSQSQRSSFPWISAAIGVEAVYMRSPRGGPGFEPDPGILVNAQDV